MLDVEELLASLSLEDKVKLVSGASAWRTHPIDTAGIPVLKVSDGPNGVRGDGGVAAASFPVGICMASTWDSDLIEQVGHAIGEEAKSKDVQVVLGPTINIHRTPVGGRNFECYSEDPHLSGMLACAFTDGIQAEGVGACLKHYVCNDSEFERHTISVEIDERTLREIYLRPFELAVKRSRPWTVMAAYNRINGVYACSHDRLINQVLKDEWAFDGLVISDWFAAKETVANALGGLDLEMPGGPNIVWGEALKVAVDRGDVPESLVDDKVRRLLRVLDWSGRFENRSEAAERAMDMPAHRALAYRAAVEGAVLLKNDGVLPLAAEEIKKLAVIGPNVTNFRIMGGGSSALKPHYVATPLDALGSRLPEATITTCQGCLTHKYIPAPDRGLLSPDAQSDVRGLTCRFYAEGFDDEPVDEKVIGAATVMLGSMAVARAGAAVLEGAYLATESGVYEFGLLSTGRARLHVNGELLIDNWTDTEQGEAFFTQATTEKRGTVRLDRDEFASIRIEYESVPGKEFSVIRYGILPPQPADSIAEAEAAARDSDAVVLVVGTNDDWETEGNDRATLSLPGEQDELIRRVAAANPKTVVVNNSGSPISMPWLDQAPAVLQTWFAGQEFGNALADMLIGRANPAGKLPITFPRRLEDTPAFTSYPGEFGQVRYGEGVFVGYRWYDARDVDPLFPFGHGLSYTTFDIGDLELGQFDTVSGLSVACTVSNSGDCAGGETVQVYVEPLTTGIPRPLRELKGFAKVALEAGERASVSVSLDAEAFAHWSVADCRWVVAPGRYRIAVGSSSRDIRCSGVVTIE
jgi:beta-glucosidase